MKYNKTTLAKLEQFLSDLKYRVRYEKGHFKSGHCIVEEQKTVVVNKFYDTEGRVQALLEILMTLHWDESTLSDASLKFARKLSEHLSTEEVES